MRKITQEKTTSESLTVLNQGDDYVVGFTSESDAESAAAIRSYNRALEHHATVWGCVYEGHQTMKACAISPLSHCSLEVGFDGTIREITLTDLISNFFVGQYDYLSMLARTIISRDSTGIVNFHDYGRYYEGVIPISWIAVQAKALAIMEIMEGRE